MKGFAAAFTMLMLATPAMAAKPDAATVTPLIVQAQAACYAQTDLTQTALVNCTWAAAQPVWRAQDLDPTMQKALADYRVEMLDIAQGADAKTVAQDDQFRRRARAEQQLRQAMFGRTVRLTNPGLDPAHMPSREDLVRVFPAKASAEKKDGQAMMSCRVMQDGALADCRVVSERPPGYGFGEAAVALASLFRAKPATLDGQPIGGAEIRFALDFNPAWL